MAIHRKIPAQGRHGFTDSFEIKFNDPLLAAQSSAGSVTFTTAIPLPRDGIVSEVAFYLVEAFDGGATSQLNMTVGSTEASDDADGYITSVSLHADNSAISSAVNTGAYFNDGTTANTVNHDVLDETVDDHITVTLTTVGAGGNALTQGKVVVLAKIVDFAEYAGA